MFLNIIKRWKGIETQNCQNSSFPIIFVTDCSSFALKINLASLKTKIDKINTDKLKAVPHNLAKLSNLVKNDVVKKTEYSSLKTKVDKIDTSDFVSKTKYEKDGSNFEDKLTKIENKISDITNLATKSSLTSLLPTSTFNIKITETENKIASTDNKIPSICNLSTKTELTNVENKIPDSYLMILLKKVTMLLKLIQ